MSLSHEELIWKMFGEGDEDALAAASEVFTQSNLLDILAAIRPQYAIASVEEFTLADTEGGWADLETTGGAGGSARPLDIVLTGISAGDVIEFGASGFHQAPGGAAEAFLAPWTIVQSTAVSNIAAPAPGVLQDEAHIIDSHVSGTDGGPWQGVFQYEVQPEDIDVNGSVRIRLRYQSTGARTVSGTKDGKVLRVWGRGPLL